MPPPTVTDFRGLLGRYERPLIHYADSFVHDIEAARDLVQETFITYVRAITQPDNPDADAPPADTNHLEGWLFTVTRYRALDYVRKHSRIIPMPLQQQDEQSSEPCPAESAALRDDSIWLLKLVDELSPNQAEVIRLKFLSELSYKEIAEITGLSMGNVGFLLHTGLHKLRLLAQAPEAKGPRIAL